MKPYRPKHRSETSQQDTFGGGVLGFPEWSYGNVKTDLLFIKYF